MGTNARYMDMLVGLGGGDPQQVRRGWALLLQERINRTALTLREATDEGEILVGVIGPSMLVAANMLNVVNRRNMVPDMVAQVFDTAERNLEAVHNTLSEVREIFRERAFPDL
ncbi:hypothetical protein GCM10017600_68950 [Streptosporangium carneum]|uniref:Uncharacterized protein n=2 Tax=Streptosporangium carneum TaxID=47481 RepID=A0A9W6I977_9ACTN|nr:hypothetical protein GCM10017600_68950 [Streptosporangium carneum]